MDRSDSSFSLPANGIDFLLDLNGFLGRDSYGLEDLPSQLPQQGLGDLASLERLAPVVLGGATDMAHPGFFGYMDPPTPWVTWIATYWNAALNQNLLHPATAPVARLAEERVVQWLAPFFGAKGGHLVPGSTVANLTALWAAREIRGVKEVVASADAHISVRKSANLLGLKYREVQVQRSRRVDTTDLGDLSNAALVLTAGTTSAGAIDPLDAGQSAAWRHIDAAWAGPLRLSARYASRLAPIDHADSVAVSAHKWFFQPKESALVFFKDNEAATEALSFGSPYLAAPNVGLLGSHGAAAIPLMATLLAWGREGLEVRLDRCMEIAQQFAELVEASPELEIFGQPESGVVLWRPRRVGVDALLPFLQGITVSVTSIDGVRWCRSVASNPMTEVLPYFESVLKAVRDAEVCPGPPDFGA